MSEALGPRARIRTARPDDADFLRDLARRAFLSYGSYDDYLGDWFRNEAVSTFIAEIDSKAVGFVMIGTYPDRDRPSRKIADIIAIAVEPDSQSRGIGGAMVKHAVAVAEREAADEVRLAVAEGNARAQRLFSKSGFRLREGVGIYPTGQRALQMAKVLKAGKEIS